MIILLACDMHAVWCSNNDKISTCIRVIGQSNDVTAPGIALMNQRCGWTSNNIKQKCYTSRHHYHESGFNITFIDDCMSRWVVVVKSFTWQNIIHNVANRSPNLQAVHCHASTVPLKVLWKCTYAAIRVLTDKLLHSLVIIQNAWLYHDWSTLEKCPATYPLLLPPFTSRHRTGTFPRHLVRWMNLVYFHRHLGLIWSKVYFQSGAVEADMLVGWLAGMIIRWK